MQEKQQIASLVARVRTKDLAAMKILYELCAREVMASSLRITNNLADSEDILQEAFVDSFQKIHQLRENKKYLGWLKRMVINKSLLHLKKRKSYVSLEDMNHLSEENAAVDWYQSIPFSMIRTAIQELPEGCREIFSLYLLEGYKHREIADLLEISLSTSKSQYQYALRLLREKLYPKVDADLPKG